MAGRPSQEFEAEVVVVGSGIAGLSFALKAAEHARVLLLTKKNAAESNTNYAQGGIACVTSSEDSAELHIRDTMESGAGLCRERVVREVVQDGPARVAELVALGVKFTERKNGSHQEPDLGKEAGHSKRRVLHAGDITGRELEKGLVGGCSGLASNPSSGRHCCDRLGHYEKDEDEGAQPCCRAVCVGLCDAEGCCDFCESGGLGNGGLWKVLSVYDQSGDCDWGRRGDGLSGRCGDCEYGVCSVSPHLSFSSVGTKLSDIGSSAGRGWVSGECQR